MHDYRLVIRQEGDTYQARWIDAHGQSGDEFPLALPLGKEQLDELRWYLEQYYEFPYHGNRVRAERVEQQLEAWGHALFAALFHGQEGIQLYNNLMDQAEATGCTLTLGSESPEVLAQPWEMLRDRRGPLGLRGVAVRRQLVKVQRNPKYDFTPPLRILLIVARPRDAGFIDPRNSIPPLLDAIDALGDDAVELDFCEPPTLAQLDLRVSAARKAGLPYHIVHFDGHGQYFPKTGIGALCFEDEQQRNHLVSGKDLGDLLSRLDVPLALLEACRGADLSSRPVFGSVAPALLQAGVGSVVAFSHSVHIAAARILVQRFYRELAEGHGVGRALEESRAALRADPKRFLNLGPDAESVALQDWFIPQLYQVGADPVLFSPVPAPSATGSVEQGPSGRGAGIRAGLDGFPPPPLYRFHGRAPELLEVERAFRRHPAVLLHAMGGMGKTALAREAAHWWRRKGVFDSAVFHSFEQYAGAEGVVQALGRALHGEDFPSLTGAEQRQTAVRLFRETRVLLVWDNFESTLAAFNQPSATDHPSPPGSGAGGGGNATTVEGFSPESRADLLQLYRELTEGEPQGRLLVTCRPVETGLPGIKEIPLAGLAAPDALHLLRAVTERKGTDLERDGYEREAMEQLLQRLDHHPLSIELVTPHLRALTPAHILADFSQLLEQFNDDNSFEGRNRSLLASLNFSAGRLSPNARAALPYLAWFEGGVFEAFFLAFAQLDEAAWAGARAELEATALLKVESLEWINSPYLKLHPTLPFAAAALPSGGGAEEANRNVNAARYIGIYLDVMRLIDQALQGAQPTDAMETLRREENNYRRALHLAFSRGEHHQGWQLTDTLRKYLERAGRLRERNTLTAWVQAQLPQGEGVNEAICDNIRQHAWSLVTQGQAKAALEQVQALLRRLRAGESTGDATFQIAVTQGYLARIYVHAGRPDQALEPGVAAIRSFEALGETQLSNLCAVLGHLANAYRKLGRYDEALAAAERAQALDRKRGDAHGIATGLGQIASILMEAQRYREADTRYQEGIKAAHTAGDAELEGAFLQHLGILHMLQNHHTQAIDHYLAAIRLFQQFDNQIGEMQTCDLAGSAERERGQLDAAAAWYRRGHELARALGDKNQLATIVHNLGILHQSRAEQLAEDHPQRSPLLQQAVASVEESLALHLELHNQLGAASSHSQLGILHRMLGNLEVAAQEVQRALEIHEALNHPDVWKDYNNFMEIAHARGDTEGAAQWQAKRDAKIAEVKKLRRGEGAPAAGNRGVPKEVVEFVTALAQAAYHARQAGQPMPPDAAEALAQLHQAPPPFPAIAAFFEAVAGGHPATVPDDLPPPLDAICAELLKAAGAPA